MAKKKGKRRDTPAQKPKQLREQLHKAEAGLHRAEAKRDRAQARVEALGIIADELRAQLADIEKADAKAAAETGPTSEPPAGEAADIIAEPAPSARSRRPAQASPRPAQSSQRRTRKAPPTA